MNDGLHLFRLPDVPLINPADDLAAIIATCVRQANITLTNQDIVVIAQKVVSKAEDRFVDLNGVTPSERAKEVALLTEKPPELVEVVLWDTAEIIRTRPGLLLVQHKLGFISANAGLDHSNVSGKANVVLRLPADPDASARAIRQKLLASLAASPPVLIIDTHGRPWRKGNAGVVIGLSGVAPVRDMIGTPDLYGTPLQYTYVAFTDQIAAAATLLMGEAGEGSPVVIVRGLQFAVDEQAVAADVLREKEMDLFR